MDSTGGFLEEWITGINVAINAMVNDTAMTSPTVIILNCKIDIPISDTKYLSKKNSAVKVNINARTVQTVEMNKDSEKKILKTSLFLAPIARKIPISFCLEAMETVIKLRNIKAAKTPKPTPTQKKTFLRMLIISTMNLTVL